MKTINDAFEQLRDRIPISAAEAQGPCADRKLSKVDTPDVCPKVHRWWHENKGDYASPEIAHEDVAVREIALGYDGKTLILVTDPHVTPRLYRLELKGLRATDGRLLADGLVYLTVPWRAGEVTEPKSDW